MLRIMDITNGPLSSGINAIYLYMAVCMTRKYGCCQTAVKLRVYSIQQRLMKPKPVPQKREAYKLEIWLQNQNLTND